MYKYKKYMTLAATSYIAAVLGGIASFSKIFIFGFSLSILIGVLLADGARGKIKGIFVSCLAILLASVPVLALIEEAPVLRDIIAAIFDGRVASLLESRFGSDGYLTEVNDIFNSPLTWIFGQGADAGNFRMADSQYRSLVLLGGAFYAAIFMAPIIYLTYISWRATKFNPALRPLLIYSVSLFACGVGIEVYWQPRIISLWVMLAALHIEYAHRQRSNWNIGRMSMSRTSR